MYQLLFIFWVQIYKGFRLNINQLSGHGRTHDGQASRSAYSEIKMEGGGKSGNFFWWGAERFICDPPPQANNRAKTVGSWQLNSGNFS